MEGQTDRPDTNRKSNNDDEDDIYDNNHLDVEQMYR